MDTNSPVGKVFADTFGKQKAPGHLVYRLIFSGAGKPSQITPILRI